MNFSVESRAISSFDERSDIFITVAHLPYRIDSDIPAFLASCVGIPQAYVSSYQQLVELADSGPPPHGSNGAYRPHHERIPSWLTTQNAFIHQSLLVQLARKRPSIIIDSESSQITVQDLERRNIAHHSLEYWIEEVSGSDFLHEREIEKVNGELLAAYSMILDGLVLNPEDISRSESYFQEVLRHYEIPFSHSPGIGSITLQELLKGSIRSACLMPLATGIYAGHTSLLSGDILTGFEILSGGAGMTICALSTLWVADRIMRGIKGFGGEGVAQHGALADSPASGGSAA